MARDPWLPMNFSLPEGAKLQLTVYEGPDWQIYKNKDGGHSLIAKEGLAAQWLQRQILDDGGLRRFSFGQDVFYSLTSSSHHTLAPVLECQSPECMSEAVTFAQCLRATRELDKESPLHDALYVERFSRLLPTFSLSTPVTDDVVLGFWLTGGVAVSVHSFRRLCSLMNWIGTDHLREVIQNAGIEPTTNVSSLVDARVAESPKTSFALAGRPELERFLTEHVIDIIENQTRYKALGIEFPSAIILHGPPGCGKTFAIERLIDYLGWPSFPIEASSVASPYIHETTRKVAAVFEQAMDSAPSAVIIDEMEAFLTDRQAVASSGHHRVEEVAEFLRRIPEAIKNRVLVVAMTNRIEMIDPAILRRGRFDHVVKVDMASEVEVSALLHKLVAALPREPDVDVAPLAKLLQGRPLSDVAFVVREGARRAARSGKDKLDQESLLMAVELSPARGSDEAGSRSIGFTP